MRSYVIALLLACTIPVLAQVNYEVEPLTIRPRAMDYAPTYYGDGFVMCSMRQINSAVSYEQEHSFLPFADMYYVPLDSNGAGKPELLSEHFVSPVHDGPAGFSADGNTICFTRNLDVPEGFKNHMKGQNRIGLYFADRVDGEWGEPHLFDWNHEEFSSMHPSFSHDGQLLFFASDIPGGYGGADIYICYREGSNDWSVPVNLGPQVNGPHNELFPYIHESGVLFFASNRPGGFGGIDLYQSQPIDKGFGEPLLLPEPLNSNGDDLGLCFKPDLSEGLFSSNRKGMDRIYQVTRTVQPFVDCVPMQENSYCYAFEEQGTFENDTLPLMYQWDLGDGNVVTALSVDHCYDGPGSYTVKLNIVDTLTNSIFFNEASYDLVVEDIEQPVILVNDTIPVNVLVPMDARRSNMPDFEITGYHWDMSDGAFRKGPEVDHLYSTPGEYDVRMELTGLQGTNPVPQRHCVHRKVVVVEKEEYANVVQRRNRAGLKLNEKSTYDFHQLPFDEFLMAVKDGDDVFFTVELFESVERIPLSDPVFDAIRAHYPILEEYNPETGKFSYTVGKAKELADTYDIYTFVKNLKYMEAEVMVMLEEKLVDADALTLDMDLAALEALNNTVVRYSTVYFGYKKETFEPQFEEQLDKLLQILQKFDQVDMVIGAHTDSIGSTGYNERLSTARANSVKRYFVENGLDRSRLKAIGYGEDHPIADNAEKAGREMNRRVEFKLTLTRNAIAETEDR